MNIARLSVASVIALVFPLSAFAAAFSTSPATINVSRGNTFAVAISVDPAGVKSYTMRANVSFDPSSIQLVSFVFAPKWIVLSQAGYDAEDNTSGVLIKTAGYPGGITSQVLLGTATFRAIASGKSSVSVTPSSLILDGQGKNQVSGAQGSAVVNVPVETPKQVTPITTVVEPTRNVTSVPPTKGISETNTVKATTTATTSVAEIQLAAVGGSGTSFSSVWAWLLGILIIGVIGGGIWYQKRRVNP